MEGQRVGDLRVPIISSIFCICVIAGGVLLCLYCWNTEMAKPWFPILALALIGLPWFFWFLTYLYSCMKACCRGHPVEDRQTPRRANSTASRRSLPPVNSMARTASVDEPSVESPAARKVHFASAVVVGGEERRGGALDGSCHSSSVNSKEAEMPLALNVKS